MLTYSHPNLQDLRYFREELPEEIRKSRLLSSRKFNEQIYGMKAAQSLKEREFLDYFSRQDYSRIQERKKEKEQIKELIEQQAAERKKWIKDNAA